MAPVTLENLGRLLRERRGKMGMREAAAEIGVSIATLSRLEAGKLPDIETFKRLCAWLDLDAGEVLGARAAPRGTASSAPKETLRGVHLKANRTLPPATAAALGEMIMAADRFFSGTAG
jgi:transcriptional regulator with XRE-family HTH domain